MFNFLILILTLFISFILLIKYFFQILALKNNITLKPNLSLFFLPSLFLSISLLKLYVILKAKDIFFIFPSILSIHLVSFCYVYLFLHATIFIIDTIDNKLFKINIINNFFNKFNIKDKYIIHPSFNFSKETVYTSFKLQKILLILSYFFSIILFKFFFELKLSEFFISIKDDFEKYLDFYSNIFIFSIIPIIYSLLKSKTNSN